MERIYPRAKKNKSNKPQAYLDYAATTPVDKEVKKAMEPYFTESMDVFGNPNSLHYFGQKARAAVDMAREKIAKVIGCGFDEVIFTGSATEANNLALRGIIKQINQKLKIKDQNYNSKLKNKKLRIIVSAIEHESILETAKDLEREGVEVIILPANKDGIVDLKKLKESLDENTVLVSIMQANNEIGTIQPIAEISRIINNFRDSNKSIQRYGNLPILPLFHTDAVQASQFLDCNVNELGVDLMTLSAHKIYGPKGIGALYIRRQQLKVKNQKLKAIITGGGQEFGLRSGTENVPAIVGFSKAVELAGKNREKEFKRISALKNYFIKELFKIYPKAEINGFDKFLLNFAEQVSAKPEFQNIKKLSGNLPFGRNLSEIKSLPNIINIYFPGHKAEDLLIKLDMAGVAVSSGSACASFSAKSSHVLKALGYQEERIKSSLRFSFGKFTTKDEINKTLKILKKII